MMGGERALTVDLQRPMDGDALVKALGRICAQRGWQLDYLPVSVSVAGLPQAGRKVYEDITVRSKGSFVSVCVRDGTLERGVETRGLVLLSSSRGHDLASALAELLGNELLTDVAAPEGSGPSHSESRRPAPTAGDYSVFFRVLVVSQGPWGERISAHLIESRPPHWHVSHLRIPADLPTVIDEPEALLPRDVPESDLLLLLSEHPSTPQLAPDIVLAARASALIAPIDDSHWLSMGEAGRLSRLLGDQGLEAAFPRPFCSLREVGTPAIDEFARHFGMPSMEVRSEDGRTVSRLLVRRGAPCGCTEFIAEGMAGTKLEEAVERAGLLHHHYPCLASMARVEELGDTLMHFSGAELKRQVEKEVRKLREGGTSYLDPDAL